MPFPASSLRPQQQGQPITAAVKHLLQLRRKASTETGHCRWVTLCGYLLYVVKGGSLRSPPAPGVGGRKRPSSPALGREGDDLERRPARRGDSATESLRIAPRTGRRQGDYFAAR